MYVININRRSMLLYESSIGLSPQVKKLENIISILIQMEKDKKLDSKLSIINTKLSKLFKSKIELNIIYSGSDAYNCGITCYPDENAPTYTADDIDISKELQFYGTKVVVIEIGIKLLEILTAKEMTAILLHEFGHWYYNFVDSITFVSYITNKLSLMLKGVSNVALFYTSTLSLASLMFTLSIILGSSSSFLQHKIEYKCDAFAIKYGYGDDLYSAFIKLKNLVSPNEGDKLKPKNIFSIIISHLFQTTHPTFDDRLREIIKSLETLYKSQYSSPIHKKIIAEYYANIRK